MTLYFNETHDEERAFYGLKHAALKDCTFAGSADGESALKETSGLNIEHCDFLLRYPLWHTNKTILSNCKMTQTCRAALWYGSDITIKSSDLGGIKALRECNGILLKNCKINSIEFGWFCHHIKAINCELTSEYPFLKCSDMEFDQLRMTAKYSFQYAESITIRSSELDTKDAFWHSKNVTVYDSVVKGEYLGWYSENLHLVRCRIIGTQPLCYAKNLILEDCEMINCDLSFENSHVNAVIPGNILSVKNPLSGQITAGSIGELIMDTPDSSCKIISASCACYA